MSLDARRFYTYLEQDLFPAQTLAAELNLDSGIPRWNGIVTVEAVEAVYATREQAPGLRMTHEPKYLRFFQARFEPL